MSKDSSAQSQPGSALKGAVGEAEQAAVERAVAELQRRLDPAARRRDLHGSFGEHLDHVPSIVCADGLKMSVQASAYHYCAPRDSAGPWWQVEVGFPSRAVAEIAEYAEEPGRPTDTVYGYVPLECVARAIISAGGFAETPGRPDADTSQASQAPRDEQ
jgi:hypothetical protein